MGAKCYMTDAGESRMTWGTGGERSARVGEREEEIASDFDILILPMSKISSLDRRFALEIV